MEPIPKSGLHYPNNIARIYLQAMEEVMGKNGLNAILNMANLNNLVDNYPPNNLNREFDFADDRLSQVARLHQLRRIDRHAWTDHD